MKIKFDYVADILYVDGEAFKLDQLRNYIWHHHSDIVRSHAIKKIIINGQYRWTYDWDAIYYKAKQTGIINDYARINTKQQRADSSTQNI